MFLVAYHQKNWILLKADLGLRDAQQFMKKASSGYQQIGIFKQRENWQNYQPRYLIDNRDKSTWPIRKLGGLINSLDSTWF
jgi:hypothetical protein